MYENYEEWVEKLNHIRDCIKENPHRIATTCGPVIVGIIGMGVVGQGAKEVFTELGAIEIQSDSLDTISELDPTKIYYVWFGRKHFLQRDGKEDFNEEDYLENKDKYEVVFHKKYLYKLSLLINCIAWNPDYPKLLTNEQMRLVLNNPDNRLCAIGDVTCIHNGPVEFLKSTRKSDNPFIYISSDTLSNEAVSKSNLENFLLVKFFSY